MKRIQVMPLGPVPPDQLAELCSGLSQEFRVETEILPGEADPAFAFNLTRQQYHSTEILASLLRKATPASRHLLGVTPVDLYIPILTFVFGEAQLQGNCALVSTHRLRQEFYGLPSDVKLFRERLLKEAVHELGHTLSLAHCDNYECVMSASHGVEWIDLKGSHFCPECRAAIDERGKAKAVI
ncbi:MAG TPA: archaemetzincin family Zn-dependent metalloprotease [Dongiaceae bacterium]|nr:archaemetzincin family Zn-dependent metalloprotease [Dongiaceae bacterium]